MESHDPCPWPQPNVGDSVSGYATTHFPFWCCEEHEGQHLCNPKSFLIGLLLLKSSPAPLWINQNQNQLDELGFLHERLASKPFEYQGGVVGWNSRWISRMLFIFSHLLVLLLNCSTLWLRQLPHSKIFPLHPVILLQINRSGAPHHLARVAQLSNLLGDLDKQVPKLSLRHDLHGIR